MEFMTLSPFACLICIEYFSYLGLFGLFEYIIDSGRLLKDFHHFFQFYLFSMIFWVNQEHIIILLNLEYSNIVHINQLFFFLIILSLINFIFI